MSHAEKLKTKNQKLKTKNSFEFLFVGRIVRDKGINELVEAFCRLNSEKPETRLVLVGFYEQNLDPVSEETHRMIEENPNIIMAGERTGENGQVQGSELSPEQTGLHPPERAERRVGPAETHMRAQREIGVTVPKQIDPAHQNRPSKYPSNSSPAFSRSASE